MYQPLTNQNDLKYYRYSFLCLTLLNLLVNIFILVVFIKFILAIENSKALKKVEDIDLKPIFDALNQIKYIFSKNNIDDIKYLVEKINKYDVEEFFQDIETCIVNECFQN